MPMRLDALKMRPCYKEYLWGGTRLKTEYGKSDAPDVTAESWELSDHPNGRSIVAEGSLSGKTLAELGAMDHDRFWGSDCTGETFPLLVKLIDAKRDLSVQVHPSNETACAENGEQGKLEMWYIVECRPQSAIYFGFNRKIDRQEVLRRAEDGSIVEVLNRVPVARGDVFYILPGTIHAIGAGIVIAEIQQNSDTTFRVYDYQRRGVDGKMRPLHLARAVDALRYDPIVPSECRANSGAVFPEFTMVEMFSCPYFRAYRLDVRTQACLRCDGRSFHHLLCVEGGGTLQSEGGLTEFSMGDSFFLPAGLGEYTITGACRVLISRI